MLRVLLASRPIRSNWAVSTTFSTITHGALIAVAVVTTDRVPTSVREERAAERYERITFIEPARLEEARRKDREAERVKRAEREAAKRAAAAAEREARALDALRAVANQLVEVPDLVAAPDLTAVTDAWRTAPDGLPAPTAPLAATINAKSGFVGPTNGIYEAEMVERAVQPRPGNPKPRYPSALVSAGVEGSFVVRFVVDTTGGVPEDKIEFPSTMHRLFVSAVRTALLKSHYMPAMLAGHVVSQQVVQEFRFEIRQR
jgi:TonB family protein